MDDLQFGGMFHVYNRGVHNRNIFKKRANYFYFLQLFSKHIAPIVEVYAYCLMPNHFHFLLRLLDADVILNNPDLNDFWKYTQANRPYQFFSNFFNAYARAFNELYGRGTLFERPFRRIPVTTDDYFFNLVTYIHRNPQKHGFVGDFRDWPYSSYDAILHDKPTRVDKTAVFDWYGGQSQFLEAHECDPDEAKLKQWLVDDEE